MRAVMFNEYGSADQLKLEDVPKPSPKSNEVLIKIKAVSLNYSDWHMLKGDPYIVRLWSGLRKPKYPILGVDVSGIVESVGEQVKEFKIGDEVFGNVSENGLGGLAEYTCTTEETLVLKPQNISFEEAASVPQAALVGLQSIKEKAHLIAGQKVLINGASGGVGTFAVQIAKAFGGQVTAVCSTQNMELVKSIGADQVIDYTKEDFTQNGQEYDLIVAANGHHSIYEYQGSLSPTGTLVATGGSMTQIFQSMLLGPLITMFNGQKIRNLYSSSSKKNLLILSELLESKKVIPVIDKQYTLDETIDAFKYCDQGHAKGKVVIKI